MTGPFFVFCRAATGQAVAQAGCSQCIHCSLVNTKWNSPSYSVSVKRILVNVWAESFGGFSSVPELVVASAGSSFHCLQAIWHALHPMHLLARSEEHTSELQSR